MKKIILTIEEEHLFLESTDKQLSLHQIGRLLHRDIDTIRRLARDYNIKYLQEHYSFTDQQKLEIKNLYENTDLNITQIGRTMNLPDVAGFIWDEYTPEQRKERHKKLLSNQKKGKKNPMYNRTGSDHPNYKGLCSDGKGYVTVTRPDWYEGNKSKRRVFVHHIVMCEYLGITCIPKGFVVHHIDGNKLNNDINNLALMTPNAHSILHNRYLNKLKNIS